MAGRARVVLQPSGFQNLLYNINGAGRRMLERKAERVAALARLNSASNGTIPAGIVVGPVVGKKIEVISTNPHTLLVHNGSPRHFIRPRRSSPRARLRFMVGGRIVYAQVVDHPGYRGNPFLTDALRDAG